MKIRLLYRHRCQIGSLIAIEVRNRQWDAKRTPPTTILYASRRRGFADVWKE